MSCRILQMQTTLSCAFNLTYPLFPLLYLEFRCSFAFSLYTLFVTGKAFECKICFFGTLCLSLPFSNCWFRTPFSEISITSAQSPQSCPLNRTSFERTSLMSRAGDHNLMRGMLLAVSAVSLDFLG